MTIVGKEGEPCKVKAYLTGPGGEIPISGANALFSVGSIPVCRVFIPPEFLSQIPDEQTPDLYRVKVSGEDSEYTLFTGYVAGDSGRIGDGKVSAGVDLVHPARDLDETRLSGPDLHPSSVSDYSSVWSGGFTEAGQAYEGKPEFFKAGGGKLPEQIVAAMKKHLTGLSSSLTEKAGGAVKKDTLQKGIDLLGKIKFLDGQIKGELEAPLASGEGHCINEWARSRVTGSFNTARSAWDTLVAVFSEFGIYLVCDNEGGIFTSVDCSGMKSSANEMGGNYISTWDKNSAMFRNIGEVLIAGDNVRLVNFSAEGKPGGFVTYSGGKGGATLVLQVPGWLNPIAKTNDDGDGIVEAQKLYAKMVYGLERNKFRTMCVTGPLAPLTVPGTVVQVSPFSKMKPKSGQGIEDLGRKYSAYCHQISHEIDMPGQVMRTTFQFKNVSIMGSGEEIDSHPVFGDVTPFAWK
jgi:hypothetical protein